MCVHQNIHTVGPIDFLDSYKGGTYDIPAAFSDDEMKLFYSLCDPNYNGNHLIYHGDDTVNVIFALYTAYMLASDEKERCIYYIGKHWDAFYKIVNAFIEYGSFEYTKPEWADRYEDTENIRVKHTLRVKHVPDYETLTCLPIWRGNVFIFECSHLNDEILDELTYLQRIPESQVIMAGKICIQTQKEAQENPNFFNFKWVNREYTGERCFKLFHDREWIIPNAEVYKEKFNEMLRNYVCKATNLNK